MTNQQGAPEALRVEAAYGGDGKFIGYRLLSSGAPGGLLVWADQTVMSGFRIGDHFVPGYQEVIDYTPVALVEAQQPAPSAAAADPCPGCIPGGYCRTPKCGRLAALNAAPQPSPTPQADSQPAPIDMVLHCPACGMQHIDASEPPVEFEPGAAQWSNPPHRSHLCHGCGHIWRPADVPTNGVKAVKTTGKADSPIAASAPADSVTAPAGGVVAGPSKWTNEEIADGKRGIRWVTEGVIHGRPTDHDVREYLMRTPAMRGCLCDDCRTFYAPTPPAQAADPLQGAADWLAEAHGQFCVAVLQGCLMIGYNRAKRLHDAAIAARKQGVA